MHYRRHQAAGEPRLSGRWRLRLGCPLAGQSQRPEVALKVADKDRSSVYNLDSALSIVQARLARADIRERCRLAGAGCAPDGTITVSYLGQPYTVALPEGTITPTDEAGDLPLRERILVLHYIAGASGTAATGRPITYRDLPGGMVYFPTFSKRTMDPLAARFGQDAPSLIRAAEALGGHRANMGDASVVVNIFPRVPVTLVLWEGDDELPARVNLLFDANIKDYLEPEDVTVACEVLTWRLIRLSRA